MTDLNGTTGVAGLIAVTVPLLTFVLPLLTWITRSRGRSLGIDVPDVKTLQSAATIDTLVIDRWGTVTTGDLRVTAVEPLDPENDRNLRWFAGALGHEAADPVARAIARLATRGRVRNVDQHPGVGISGSVDRHPVRVGHPPWVGMDERPGLGRTVGVEVDNRPIGYLTVADEVREHASGSVVRLVDDGVTPVLVSDDNAANTEDLAHRCGIDEWHPETAPEKRARLVVELQERGRRVAVAGPRPDNDEALAAADLALTDATGPLDPGTVGLVDLDVQRLHSVFRLARKTSRVRSLLRPVAAALGLLGLGLALAGVLPPLAAVGYAVVSGVVIGALLAGLVR